MNIQEATKLAMEKRKGIRRYSRFKDGSQLYLIPTNFCGYILYQSQEKVFTPMWQPMAEDLLADDWEVMGI
ncbi:Thoeris anti-defense Tad2 family protein [Staphylococcus auricularis]|uniref:Thoeris anti-defense Tad2 family protein n=1 Tax=Staphylococcus auricularis TaxID=29379 RepID=UPI001248C94B|nr:MW1434 family type I TA system toxin [Staphylococcus auricularis]